MADDILRAFDILHDDSDNSDYKLALLSVIHLYNNHNTQCFTSLNELHKRGNIWATYRLGTMHIKQAKELATFPGYSPNMKDLQNAKKYFEIASNNGHSGAMYQLGNFYNDSTSSSAINPQKAREYYEMAIAIDKHPHALNELGNMYYAGNSVEINHKRAKELYVEAMKGGNKSAITNLLNMFEKEQEMDTEEDKWLLATLILKGFKSKIPVKYLNEIDDCVINLRMQVQELENILKYAPESEEYKKAMERFNQRMNKV